MSHTAACAAMLAYHGCSCGADERAAYASLRAQVTEARAKLAIALERADAAEERAARAEAQLTAVERIGWEAMIQRDQMIEFYMKDSGIDVEEEIAFLRGEGPDPWHKACRATARRWKALARALRTRVALLFAGDTFTQRMWRDAERDRAAAEAALAAERGRAERLREALEVIARVGCMQSTEEPEFWCKHDGSGHSCYCPAGIAAVALDGSEPIAVVMHRAADEARQTESTSSSSPQPADEPKREE